MQKGSALAAGLAAAAALFVLPGSAVADQEFIVQFDEAAGAQTRAAVRDRTGVTAKRALLHRGLQVVTVPDGAAGARAIAALERSATVRFVERNDDAITEAVPNDPLFGQLVGLHNTGQTVESLSGIADADIDAPEAWDTATGSDTTVVAVVDSGVAYNHPDLAPNMWRNPKETAGNGLDDDGNGFVDDVHGADLVNKTGDPSGVGSHGTHVAGTIAAAGDNGIGVTGVSWRSKIMALRVEKGGGSLDSAAIADAFEYAAVNGARIVNASLSSETEKLSQKEAIARHPDVLYVIAAGNQNTGKPRYPCNIDLPNILCVGATDLSDARASFSNYGPHVDMSAPGKRILSTMPAVEDVFAEDFETDDFESVWLASGTGAWQRTEGDIFGDSSFYADTSPDGNYPANADIRMRSASPIDVGATPRNCFVGFNLFLELGDGDKLTLDRSTDGTTYTPLIEFTESETREVEASLPPVTKVWLRFRLQSDGAGQAAGAAIDDVIVRCASATFSGDEYATKQGTSMATPMTAGAVAVVLGHRPGASMEFLRNSVRNTGDVLPALQNGVTSTGRRLNLVSALGYAGGGGEPTTGAARDLAQTTAGLTGAVAGRDVPVEHFFEYGPTTAYGAQTPAGTAASSDGAAAVGAAVGGLKAGTTYHARLVTVRGGIRMEGADVAFTTAAAPPPPPPPPPAKPQFRVPAKPTLKCTKLKRTIKKGKSVSCKLTLVEADATVAAVLKKGSTRVGKGTAAAGARSIKLKVSRTTKRGTYKVTLTLSADAYEFDYPFTYSNRL